MLDRGFVGFCLKFVAAARFSWYDFPPMETAPYTPQLVLVAFLVVFACIAIVVTWQRPKT